MAFFAWILLIIEVLNFIDLRRARVESKRESWKRRAGSGYCWVCNAKYGVVPSECVLISVSTWPDIHSVNCLANPVRPTVRSLNASSYWLSSLRLARQIQLEASKARDKYPCTLSNNLIHLSKLSCPWHLCECTSECKRHYRRQKLTVEHVDNHYSTWYESWSIWRITIKDKFKLFDKRQLCSMERKNSNTTDHSQGLGCGYRHLAWP